LHPRLVPPSVDFVLARVEAAVHCPRCAADREAPLRILENMLVDLAMSVLPVVVLGVGGAALYRLVVSAWQARCRASMRRIPHHDSLQPRRLPSAEPAPTPPECVVRATVTQIDL
jgi:hypothetical protein